MDNTDSKFVRPGDPRVPCFAILGRFTSELKLVNLEGESSSSVKISDHPSRGIVTINGEVFAVTEKEILKLRSDGTTEHNMSLPSRLDRWSRIVLFQKKIYIIQSRRKPMLCFDPADNSLTDDLPGCGLDLGFCASATDEFICAMGGFRTETQSMKFDPLARTWEETAPMWKERDDAAAATLDGKIYVMGGWQHPTSVEYYNPGNNSWTEISNMNAGRDEFSACVDGGRLYAVGGDRVRMENGFCQHSIEVYDKNKWTVATKFQAWDRCIHSCLWPHGSHQPGDPLPEIQHYIEKLESSVTKEERLKLFHKISEYEPGQQRDIAETIRSIDFSGIALQSPDVSAIGSIVDHSAHLYSVNLKACKLLPGSLQILRNRVMEIVKVDKFRVDGNPDLTVDDLIAGVDLCARVGARYVYDMEHLSASDRQKFTSHSRKYQPKNESAEKKMSKTRKSRIREQQFQKMYKKPSGNERERIRHVLDFNSKFEEQPEPAERSKEDPEAKMTPARSPGEEKVGSLQLDVEPAEGSKENQEEKQASGNSRRAEDVGSPQLDTEPPGGESSSGTARKIRPRTLNEFVKLKPVEKFNKIMKSASSGEEVLEAGGPAMHARMLKTMAMNSDRRRFESASLNKFGSKLRSHMRNTRLEVSTGIVKSSKDHSGYKTRSSFSETLSCKSNLRRYSRRSDQDTERKSNIESTQAASLERIEEDDTAAENFGSSDSGISPKTGTHRQKHEHDPKRLVEQKFEMTVLGLWATQSRQEQLQLWMENAQFDVFPTDLESIEDIIDDVMERLLWQIEEEEAQNYRPADWPLEKHESIEGCIDRIAAEFKRSSKRKAIKTRELWPRGGSIDLHGNEVLIPSRAVEKKTKVKVSLHNNPDNLPRHVRAISSVIRCYPSKFKVPVLVRLATWISAKPGKKISVTIMSRPNSRSGWNRVQTVTLGERNVIEYKTTQFSDNVAVVEDERVNDAKHHLKNDVWLCKNEALIVSFFYKDDKTRNDLTSRLKSDYIPGIPVGGEIVASIGNTIAVEVDCKTSRDFKISTWGATDGTLKIDEAMRMKDTCTLYFVSDPHLKDMRNSILNGVQYAAKLSDSDGNTIDGGFAAPLFFYSSQDSKHSSTEAASAVGFDLGAQGTANINDSSIDVHTGTKATTAQSRGIAVGRDINVHGGGALVQLLICFIVLACLNLLFVLISKLQSYSTGHDEI